MMSSLSLGLRKAVCVFLGSVGLLLCLPMAGCNSSQDSQLRTVFSDIDFEFVLNTENAVFGLQLRPLVIAGRSDIPREFTEPLPRCTGFFIAEDLFLTAYHCLPYLQVARFNHLSSDMDWLEHVAVGAGGRLSFTGEPTESELYPLSGDDLLWSDAALDVALVRWPHHASKHGVLKLCRDSVWVDSGNVGIQLLGFPQGLPLTRSAGVAMPLNYGDSAALFRHDTDSLAGQSGGPVLVHISAAEKCVLGVHLRGAGRNQFTVPLSESQQLSARAYAKQACLDKASELRSRCEEDYVFNKAVKMSAVLQSLKTQYPELWNRINPN